MSNNERDELLVRLVTAIEQMNLTCGRILAAHDTANQTAFECKEMALSVLKNVARRGKSKK